MRFEMSRGNHEPAGHHYVVLDGHGRLMDLSLVTAGTLHDPTMAKVTWGMVSLGSETREGGQITRTDGSRQTFFDRGVIKPYIDAFKAAAAA